MSNDKKNDIFITFCNECGWKEMAKGLPYQFCPKCDHVNIGFSNVTNTEPETANKYKRKILGEWVE